MEQYLSGSLPLHDFWKTFNFGFADAPEGAFSEEEEAFFAEVDDELHHTDSETPPDPALRSEREFRAWLKRRMRGSKRLANIRLQRIGGLAVLAPPAEPER